MNKKEIEQYLLENLNMALDPKTGETSYTNGFDIRANENGFKFIPRLPSSFIVNDDLYERIYEISNVALYPEYTVLKQNGAYIISEEINDIHIQRALFFPWLKGIPRRLIVSNLDSKPSNQIQLMQDLAVDYDKVTSIAIAGNSGSGKTYFLLYLLQNLKYISNLAIVDPKLDSPARWGRDNNIKIIYPNANRSKADFVNQVNNELSIACNLINTRQRQLFSNPTLTFKHHTVVIDEVLALTEGVPKQIKDSFYALLSQIALMGRATNVHLILVSQRFDHNTIPIAVREQLNVLIQIGNINSKTTQFLFPDLDPTGIVIPTGIGTGLIQIIDAEHPYQIQPFLTPTYNLKGESINEKRSY